MGDAYYFIGAEYGGRAWDELQKKNPGEAVNQIRLGHSNGGFPDWLIEYGKNVLRPCPRDAILFVGGDAEINPILYLQWIERFRTDITVIPIALLNRPWYIAILKSGLKGLLIPASISWGEQTIFAARPYKWSAQPIQIAGLRSEFLEYEITPDLSAGDRGLLSVAKTLILDIVQTNQWKRPIHFSLASFPWSYTDFLKSLEISGITLKLTPTARDSKKLVMDQEATERLLFDPHNFSHLSSIKEKNMPRISSMLNNYRHAFLWLAQSHMEAGKKKEATRVLELMDSNIPENLLSIPEELREFTAELREKVKN